METTRLALAGTLALGVLSTPALADSSFVALFDGRSTQGWIQRGGRAPFTVEDGVLVGRTLEGEKNSFLCPPGTYADFVLEFEVWVDPALNSGVQIRSHETPDYRDGVVHGYQVEIDPSPRAWSGGIYDEQRRGWLQNPKDDPAAQKAFRRDEWNRFRIEAKGDRLRTWVNGVAVADLVDGLDRAGFVGFQVHAAKRSGLAVKWRDIRIRELPHQKTGQSPNTLTEEEREAGWRLLWDGRSGWGWRSAQAREFPKQGWEMKDGALTVLGSSGAGAPGGGDILTEASFAAFELKFEFRLTPGANSGVKYYVHTDLEAAKGSAVGLEYQLLDDDRHPDAKRGRDGNRTLASLYDLLPASNTKARPAGEWNAARIVSDGVRVEHWLNGTQVLEYERGTEAFRERIAQSKYQGWPGFGELAAGPILLQDHGDRVSFRNLKIREIPAGTR